MATETALAELIATLEKATLMAKQIPTTDQNQTIKIYATLHAAPFHLSSFLAQTSQPFPQPSLLNSLPSDDQMQLGDDHNHNDSGEEQNSMAGMIEDCFIQNKRLKAAAVMCRHGGCAGV